MADISTLDALQALHRELVALASGGGSGTDALENELLFEVLETELDRTWTHPQRSDKSRNAVKSGKITLDGNEFSVNEKFQQDVLLLSDEIDLDEVEASRYLLDSQEDPAVIGRSLLECSIIRFHQQRKYALDALRLLLELDSKDDDSEEGSGALERIKMYVETRILRRGADRSKRLPPRCIAAMATSKTWLQRLGEKISAAQTLGTGSQDLSEEYGVIEFARVSLIQQHESLGVILCRSIEKRQADVADFLEFLTVLKKADKYDTLLVHLIPAIGAYMSAFASSEGGRDLAQARDLNKKIFPPSDDSTWPLAYLHATVRAWWLAEYGGFYLDDPPASAIPPGTDLDEEDRQRSKQFLDSLKDGAFDFMLSVAGDVRSPDWYDSVRVGMRKWLQRKSSPLATERAQFSDFFQLCLMSQLEIFVDAFISNLPDVLRKLRVEEDEQRQLSQAHEQDLDLERFLLIIAYAYEGRPDASANFWQDPESNLAGFMHWASRRASTPLVAAFCEMLQAISGSDECATAAHEFLLDEGHHSSGKMRRTQSLTWNQIFKELDFFSEKIRHKPTPPQTTKFRGGKPTADLAEMEPESAMMLECYLRLITKLASESETTRNFLLQSSGFNLVEMLLELASSPIPPQLRGSIFLALKALMTRKTLHENLTMWRCLENWITGAYAYAGPAGGSVRSQPPPMVSMERILDEMSCGFEDPDSFIKLLLELVTPAIDSSPLNDGLLFPENLGAGSSRSPGIEVYVDFVIGMVFSKKIQDLSDIHQTRVLRLSCLEFILTCLNTFNEDLLLLVNETNIPIDAVISATDLATYVKMHPFARVMEWMFNDRVMTALFNTIHQKATDVGTASANSPIILGILRAVEVISKVLDLQTTYVDLVRPLLKAQPEPRRQPVANAAYASFEDGLVTRLNLVVDIGKYCGLGHSDLTLACLKLLEKMSSSSRITAEWSGSSRHFHRNKAIVAMEANGEHDAISRAFIGEIVAPVESGNEIASPGYMSKMYILDFLYKCLDMTPKEPTIAHLLLGFKCGTDALSVDANGAFASRTSLFHSLLGLLLECPSSDAQGMRQWSVSLKSRVMRIFKILWGSPLSSAIVIQELRDNELLFHLLVRETVIQPDLPWEGQSVGTAHFPVTDGATALSDFLALRSISLEYIAMELCMIAQSRMPGVKRRIFDALNGQIVGEGNETIQTPTVFDLYDFILPDGFWEIPPPALQYYNDLSLTACQEKDADGNQVYNIDRVREVLLLKRSEAQGHGELVSAHDLAAIEKEEAAVVEYLVSSNRQKQITAQCLQVMRSWTKLLLVMVESCDFKGSAQTSFFLQTLQAILPSLEVFASDRPEQALELARLAGVLLFKLDLTQAPGAADTITNTDTNIGSGSGSGNDKQSKAIGHLVSDKLFQVFQVCLQAIGKRAGTPELRAIYYEICYRYLTGMSEDEGPLSASRPKTFKTVQVYGERLINVVCDDAFCGEPTCQTAALIFLGALVHMDSREGGESYVVETLNRLNFIGILIDSLRDIMREWHDAYTTGNADQQNYQNARLAIVLQLAQSRPGAKYILHANLFRTLDASGLFAADPDLLVDAADPRALAHHYDLLAKAVRVVGAAVLSRGSHNVAQGRRFLADHRMLVTHALKRSAGIGAGNTGGNGGNGNGGNGNSGSGGGDDDAGLDARVEELADALVVLIAATGFLEFESEALPETKQADHVLFH